MKSCDLVSDFGNKRVCMCLYNNFTHDSRVLKEALSLYQAGYSITVIARLDDKTLPYENRNGIIVKRISVNPVHLRLIGFIRRLWKCIIADPKNIWNIIFNKTNMESHIAHTNKNNHEKIRNRGLVDKLRRVLVILDFNYRIIESANDEEYGVFHAHDLNTLIGAYVAAKKQGAKLIYDSHELYLERNRFVPYKPIGKWIRKRVEAYLIKRSDHVITVNDSLARMLADTYKIKLPTVVMNTPSLQEITLPGKNVSLRHAIGIQDNYHILLYSGAITFNRGLENIIRSLVYLPQCYLVLMGYGKDNYKRKLKAVAAENGVASRFSFFGPVPSDQVTLYAASAGIGVAAIENVCLSYYYCSPNKLFEYLLAGLPVIASDFPEMSHIINQHCVGTTFDPGVPKDIARAAREILEAHEKWKNIKEKTHSVASIYNWENESRKLIDIYESLL